MTTSSLKRVSRVLCGVRCGGWYIVVISFLSTGARLACDQSSTTSSQVLFGLTRAVNSNPGPSRVYYAQQQRLCVCGGSVVNTKCNSYTNRSCPVQSKGQTAVPPTSP